MRKLFTLLALLALTLPVLATLPNPEVRYNPATPELDLTFTINDYWPPLGAVAWKVGINDGTPAVWSFITVSTTDKFVRVPLARPLVPGQYFLHAAIVDAGGVALEQTEVFAWDNVIFFGGDLPRVVVGGPEGWDTGIAVSCHDAENGTTLEWELYDEDGALVVNGVLDIPPHGCPSFNFSSVVTPPPGGTFVGSAKLRSLDPVAVVYLCDSRTTRGFSLIQILHEIN